MTHAISIRAVAHAAVAAAFALGLAACAAPQPSDPGVVRADAPQTHDIEGGMGGTGLGGAHGAAL